MKFGISLALGASCFPVALVAADTNTLPKFFGSQSCANSLCHGGADDKRNQFNIWLNKDFHTRAHATLSLNRSARIAETLKIADATTDSRCTVCHNPFQAVPVARKDPRVGKLEGVSCESCHNAAENWLLTHTRSDLKYEQKVAAGMRDLKNLYVRANTCVACHQNLEPELRAAGHPELMFEMDGQCATMPRHWTETNRLRGAQAWLVGQAVAWREAQAQLSRGSPNKDAEHRNDAIGWLLQSMAEPHVDIAAADDYARHAATAAPPTLDRVRIMLLRLAQTGKQFRGEQNPAETKERLPHRAERLVLGLERLLIALGVDKKSAASGKLDQLFKDIQSRPDFDPKKFAEHLAEFEAVLPK